LISSSAAAPAAWVCKNGFDADFADGRARIGAVLGVFFRFAGKGISGCPVDGALHSLSQPRKKRKTFARPVGYRDRVGNNPWQDKGRRHNYMLVDRVALNPARYATGATMSAFWWSLRLNAQKLDTDCDPVSDEER
jgi:hypothetical protein